MYAVMQKCARAPICPPLRAVAVRRRHYRTKRGLRARKDHTGDAVSPAPAEGDGSGKSQILKLLRDRRDAGLASRSSIDPNSTERAYRTSVPSFMMSRKGFLSVGSNAAREDMFLVTRILTAINRVILRFRGIWSNKKIKQVKGSLSKAFVRYSRRADKVGILVLLRILEEEMSNKTPNEVLKFLSRLEVETVVRLGKDEDNKGKEHGQGELDAEARPMELAALKTREMNANAGTESATKPPSYETGWKAPEWATAWPEADTSTAEADCDSAHLKPKSVQASRFGRLTVQSKSYYPLAYTRRVEGILDLKADRPPVLSDVAPISEHRPIANLAHGLDRVLFSPGVHWVQDPRSQVYNFDPWVQSIPLVDDFAFDRVQGFVSAGKDEELSSLARRENRQFTGSTSSLTGLLSHIYFMLSEDKEVDISTLSLHFKDEPRTFTPGQRVPVSLRLERQDGHYAITSYYDGPSLSEKSILTWLGTLMEKFLTSTEDKFKKLLKATPINPDEDIDTRKEAYRYAKSNKFVMRSQLDCQDHRLPGGGVFDLKTRAAVPLRLDLHNWEENSGYLIRTLHGPIESFEREYYDLIRSAFLKYSFQARIGNMDGIFVAYHNTARIFGFQYLPLEEMDARLYGRADRGPQVFDRCVLLMEELLPEVVSCFPGQSVRILAETPEKFKILNIFVEPDEWDEGQNGPRPIAQINVKCRHFLGNREVSGAEAIENYDQSWMVHWTITRSSRPEEDLRRYKSDAQERMFFAWSLPSGTSLKDMARKWDKTDFGGKRIALDDAQTGPKFDPGLFKTRPSWNVENLRRISRQGRLDLEEAEKAHEGKPKIILGQPYTPSDTTLEPIPLESGYEESTGASADEEVHNEEQESEREEQEKEDVREDEFQQDRADPAGSEKMNGVSEKVHGEGQYSSTALSDVVTDETAIPRTEELTEELPNTMTAYSDDTMALSESIDDEISLAGAKAIISRDASATSAGSKNDSSGPQSS